MRLEFGALEIRVFSTGGLAIYCPWFCLVSTSTTQEFKLTANRHGKPSYDELVQALEAMALQYLQNYYRPGGDDNDVLTHSFISAGEACLEALETLGKVEYLDDDMYRWAPGHPYRCPDEEPVKTIGKGEVLDWLQSILDDPSDD